MVVSFRSFSALSTLAESPTSLFMVRSNWSMVSPRSRAASMEPVTISTPCCIRLNTLRLDTMEPKADLILLTPEDMPEESILVLILISPSYAMVLTS